MADLDVRERQYVSVLTPEVAEELSRMRRRYALWETGCIAYEADQGPRKREDLPAKLSVKRCRVRTGEGDAGTYNHQAQIAKFKGRYYYAFTNGVRDEFGPGQRTMVSSSKDGYHWTDAVCVAPADVEKGMFHETSGLYADEKRMVLYVMTKTRTGGKETHTPQMLRYIEPGVTIDAWTTTDGESWTLRGAIVESKDAWMFEAPRLTREGTLLVAGSIDGFPVAYRWTPEDPAAKPEIVEMPRPDPPASLMDGEGSWYQLDSGKIVMFWRDAGFSERLYVTSSDDNGDSWAKPLITDYPDSVSRVYAGRLPDERFFLVGNAFAKLFDRRRLMLSLSDDGLKFNRTFRLLDDPTAQRAFGLLKCHGYQYPFALVEEERLLVGYSVNKEDMECVSIPYGMLA